MPTTWRILPYTVALDPIGNTPTVLLHLDTARPHPAAPLTVLDVSYKLTLIEPKVDPIKRDQALDNKLIQLIEGINATPGLVFESVQSALYSGTGDSQYIAYEITLTAPLNLN